MNVRRHHTVIHNFLERSERLADTVVFRWPVENRWETATGRDLVEQTQQLGAGLLSLGLCPGDRVGIIARTSPDWFLADMAIQHAHGIVVPLFSDLADDMLRDCIHSTGCRYLFVDDEAVLDRLSSLNLPSVVTLIGCGEHRARSRLIPVADLRARGAEFSKAQPGALAERLAMVDESDIFTIVYTSGTTAAPKGVMLTHRNALCAANAYLKRMSVADKQVYVSYAPLSHISERLATTVIATIPESNPGEIWFVPDMKRFGQTLQEAHPTSLAGPPIAWMKLRARILAGLDAEGQRGRMLARLLESSTETVHQRAEGQAIRADRTLTASLARSLLGGALRRRLGLDRLVSAYSAAASLPPEVQYFFEAIGVPLGQAWGLTETFGAGAAQSANELEAGLVGAPHEGMELKLTDEGEILVRGDCVFAGYWRDVAATRLALDREGWLHTGDLGELRDDGRLSIMDRKSSRLTLSTGTKLWPRRMELALRASPLVSDAVAVGEGRPHAAMFIALDPEEVSSRIGATGVSMETHPLVKGDIERRIRIFNASVSTRERVGAWRVFAAPFPRSVYTSTRKIKRDRFREIFADEIEKLYEEASDPVA